jgi:transposase
VLDVERWAELRREHFVRGVPIKELVRRTGLARNTVRGALRSGEPPVFRVPERPSKLDPFKDEIHRLLKDDAKLSGVRVREEIEPLGFDGGKTIVDDYLREIRPIFLKLRTHQRTVYRPGEVCQWDLWETSSPVPVGHGQVRRAWVVVACLGYSRAGAGALVFSKEAPDVLWGMTRCVWSLGALPELMVWDREGCLHAGGGRPTQAYAEWCGRLPVGWYFCEPADPQAKGAVERLQGYLESNFEPGRRFANHLDFQLQLDAWFEKANARTHKTLRERPVDRLLEEREVMRLLPGSIWIGAGCCGWRPIRTSGSIPTTTRWIRTSSAGASRFASASASSPRWRWTRASSSAGMSGCSRRTGRSPRSSTPGRCASVAASRPSTS